MMFVRTYERYLRWGNEGALFFRLENKSGINFVCSRVKIRVGMDEKVLGGVGEIRRLVRLEWHLPGEEERDDRECRGLGHLP